jgi:hypothetical protein
MLYVFRLGFALALSLALVAGCSDENGEGGTGGMAGEGGAGGMAGEGGSGGNGVACVDNVCPCSEAGIRAAIAEGGGPFTFDCDGPKTVVTGDRIEIDEDVILDGEGNLTVDGSFRVNSATELRRLNTTNGRVIENFGTLTFIDSVISNHSDVALLNTPDAAMTLIDSTVSDNHGAGIYNYGGVLDLMGTTVSGNSSGIVNLQGTANVVNSTVSGNTSHDGGGISSVGGSTTLLNSTVSGNTATRGGGGIEIAPAYSGGGTLTLISSTIWGNISNYGSAILAKRSTTLTIVNTLLGGTCALGEALVTSGGHNVESPGNTCGLDQATDQVSVSMSIGQLQDNGGPTMTHASLHFRAIDQIPAEDCVDADGAPLTTDQRGEPRPETGGSMCDVGAFEVQPSDLPP